MYIHSSGRGHHYGEKLVIAQYFAPEDGAFHGLAMYNGYQSSEFFRGNDSVHLIAGNRLGILI